MPEDIVQPAIPTTPVEPAAGAPASVPEETAAPAATGKDLPDDVLKIPAIQGIMAGAPPAFSADFATFEKLPEAKVIASNKDALMNAGIAFYHARMGNTGVVFNQLKISPEQIKQADEAGQLGQIAPPFQQVNDMIKASGDQNPVLAASAPQEGLASPTPPNVPQASSGAMPSPAPASVQTKLAGARSKNIQPGSPTSGPKPGSGRLLNAILKRAV